MKKIKCAGVVNRRLKMSVIKSYYPETGMRECITWFKRYDFKFIFGFPFRIFPVLFILIFQSIAQVTFALAFHFRLIPVLAKEGSYVILFQLIVEENKALAESLTQKANN